MPVEELKAREGVGEQVEPRPADRTHLTTADLRVLPLELGGLVLGLDLGLCSG